MYVVIRILAMYSVPTAKFLGNVYSDWLLNSECWTWTKKIKKKQSFFIKCNV